jgi:hypothetical protein
MANCKAIISSVRMKKLKMSQEAPCKRAGILFEIWSRHLPNTIMEPCTTPNWQNLFLISGNDRYLLYKHIAFREKDVYELVYGLSMDRANFLLCVVKSGNLAGRNSLRSLSLPNFVVQTQCHSTGQEILTELRGSQETLLPLSWGTWIQPTPHTIL